MLVGGGNSYGKAIDMSGVGCIFAEMLEEEILFGCGDGIDTEINILQDIFKKLGIPDKSLNFTTFDEECPSATEISPKLSALGNDLLLKILCVDSNSRITAREALDHPFFKGT